MRPRLRLIGDVHGLINKYIPLAKAAEYSIQVGDMGFASHYTMLNGLSMNHRFVQGNHDDYDNPDRHILGDFGVHTVPGFGDVFFVRGAWSIDYKLRVKQELAGKGKSWWQQEELSIPQLEAAFELYKQVRPDFVVSHDCPQSIKMELTNPEVLKYFGFEKEPQCRTSLCLQAMFEEHQPNYWAFGHYHKSFHEVRNGTRFQCLNELEVADFHKRWVR